MALNMSKRAVLGAIAVVGLAVPLAPAVKAALPGSAVPPLRAAVVDKSHQLCSRDDHVEPGLQGDVPKAAQDSGEAKKGFNCGLSLVGRAILDGKGSDDGVTRSATGNANTAWSGDCAYVSGDGIAVVDAKDPAHPRHVRTLHGAGSDATIETLNAVDAPSRPGFGPRHVLVTGKYGIGTPTTNMPMDIWDVSDCASPKHLQTFLFPENIHNLTISGDGHYVFATMPLQVVDLDPLFDHDDSTTSATFLGNLSNATPFPLVPTEPGPDVDDGLPAPVRDAGTASQGKNHSHEAWPNFDGTKLYLGGVTVQSEVFTIVDITKWLQRDAAGNPVGAPEVLSQRTGRGHSVRTGTIQSPNGPHRILLHSEEAVFGTAKGCLPEKANPFAGPAEAYLMNIDDERNPRDVSQMGLEINKAENCPAQLQSGVDASTHYHDFDSETDTHFAAVSMWNAGVRVFDVRNPEHPYEVAYYNPADVGGEGTTALDKAWGHIRYVAKTGQLWFATASGGFWIVELAPQVRDHFALPTTGSSTVVHPNGWPGTTGSVRLGAAVPIADITPWYCTLGSVLAGV